ncbi:MAG TPA: biotin/lipoyl-containing protein [Candidatus Sulfomarinibacteraceae bacterium]|nr:biotin/lipoyl-containing protein [Candidatus Sulfomarinibacteraceae bacterium]
MADYVLKIGDREYRARVEEITAESATIAVDGTSYKVELVEIGRRAEAPRPASAPTRRPTPAAPPVKRPSTQPSEGAPGAVLAPLPGSVLRIAVAEGDTVQAGQTLIVMEAMKMENAVAAPHHGTVRKIFVAEGANVGEGDPLVEIGRPEMTTL